MSRKKEEKLLFNTKLIDDFKLKFHHTFSHNETWTIKPIKSRIDQ